MSLRCLLGLILLSSATLAACEQPYVIDGPPVFEVGTGEYAFEPVADGDKLPIYNGQQGGSHVWLGVRVANMQPRQFHLETDLVITETDTPTGFDLFFDVDLFRGPSGDMEYAGLPLQIEPNVLRGVRIRATITATDRDGRVMTDTMEIVPQ